MNVALTDSVNETNAIRRQRTLREATPSPTTAFDALLAGLHVAAQPTLDSPVLSESAMFDAPEREGGGRPPLREDAGSLSNQSDPSRTDVRARRATAEAPTRATQQVDIAVLKSSSPRGAAESLGEALPDHARRDVASEAPTNRSPVEPAARHTQAAPAKESTVVARGDASQPHATSQRVSASGETRAVDGANNRMQNAAKAVGRVLGAPQSTGTEAARATGAGQGSLNQGKAAAGKSLTPSHAPPKQEAARESSFARMVRSLRIRPGSRNSSATIRLEPERLGRMRVDVKMSGDRISIEVRTETTEARELVASRATELRAALERQGLQIERFEVRGDLAEAGVADRPFGPKAEERNESGSSKRGSRGRAVESSSTVSDRASAAVESELVDGDEARASPAVESAIRRQVDIRV